MISGRGSNMLSLIKAASAKNFPAEIVGVIASSPDAAGLQAARENDIPTAINSLKTYSDKAHADRAISEVLQDWRTDIICLAGFMRILSAEFVLAWEGKLINIHPSLLPKYKGLNTHRRALAAKENEHGCSVHFVVPELDAGPVIAQMCVPIHSNDCEETLAEQVLKAEHILYPRALDVMAQGKVYLHQGEARWTLSH